MICDFISILLDKIMKNTEKSKKSLLFKKRTDLILEQWDIFP